MINSSRVNIDFEFVDPCLCNAWVGAAIIGSAVIGAGSNLLASDKQSKTADKVAQMQMQQYGQTREDLSPYRAAGASALDTLNSKLPDLTKPISVNPNDFKDSDYYKFLSTQGQKAVTNSSAARGLASSGAALKGATTFAKNLASTEWQNNFNMQNINNTNTYSRLKGLVDTGQNAAAQTGSFGAAATQAAGTALVGGANAQAAGINSAGNAISNGVNNLGGYQMYQGLYGKTGGGPITYGGPNGPVAFS